MSREKGTSAWTTLTLTLLCSCFLYVCKSAFLKCCPWRTVPLQRTCENWGIHEPSTEVFQGEQIRSGFMSWVFKKLQESLFLSHLVLEQIFRIFAFPVLSFSKSPVEYCSVFSPIWFPTCFSGIIVWVTSQRFALHLVRWDLSEGSLRREEPKRYFRKQGHSSSLPCSGESVHHICWKFVSMLCVLLGKSAINQINPQSTCLLDVAC